MNTNDIQLLTKDVCGFLSQNGKNLREGEVLYHLARRCPKNGVIVEIGSWQGKSTIWLGYGSKSGPKAKIYAVDPHIGSPEHQKEGQVWTYDQFLKNISHAQLTDLVTPIVKTSTEAAHDFDLPIDLLFIDGAHEYESVKEDFQLFAPKVKEGGVIAFHDSFLGWPGVNQVIKEELFTKSNFCNIRYINSITFAKKISQANFNQKIDNFKTSFIQDVHKISLKFPQPFRSIAKHTLWKPHFEKWLNELND